MAKQQNGGKEPSERREFSYPYYSLRKCLALAAAVKEYAGARAEAPKSVIAQQLGMSESSSSLSQLLGSAKAFGMIEGTRSYSLTEHAQRYFFPQTESDRRQAELDFFFSPGAYKLLISRFDGNRLPSPEMLANILLREAEVTKSWAGRAAALFLSSAAELSLIDQSGFLRYEAALHSVGSEGGAVKPTVNYLGGGGAAVGLPFRGLIERKDDSGRTAAGPDVRPDGNPYGAKGIGATQPRVNVWEYSEGGGTVRLESSDPMPRALWARLKKYVEMLAPEEPEKGSP